MSIYLDYEIDNDSGDDIHDEDCDYFDDCNCKPTGKFTIAFKLSCGPNLEYNFNTFVTLFLNKYDRTNLKKFIQILKNPEKIQDIVEKSKQKIKQDLNDSNITYLSCNGRLYHENGHTEELIFDFKNSRSNNNLIKFIPKNNKIIFCSKNYQCCYDNCFCGDCQYYGRFLNEHDSHLPFKLETKETIISAFESIYEDLKVSY